MGGHRCDSDVASIRLVIEEILVYDLQLNRAANENERPKRHDGRNGEYACPEPAGDAFVCLPPVRQGCTVRVSSGSGDFMPMRSRASRSTRA